MHLEERILPMLKAEEVLIKVVAAGINRPDIAQRLGKYPAPPGTPPDIPGLEVSGEIISIGSSVNEWQVGDRVCALLPGGGYADYAIAHQGSCLKVSGALSLAAAAALPETLFTVWHNLFNLGKLIKGEHVLIHGGSSGIGTLAIQMAKAFGADVTVTVGSVDKQQACLRLGADRVILYRQEDFLEVLGAQSVDVVLDMVGGAYFEKNIKLLKPDGRLVYINAVLGYKVALDLWQVMTKRLTITGSTLRSRELSFKQKLRDQIAEKVWPLIMEGTIRPVVYKTFRLEEVSAAHQLMEASSHVGKLLLVLE